MLIDSHCHLDYSVLYDKLDLVINNAMQEDVKYLLSISTTLESFAKIKVIVKKYKNVYGTIGIHPHETNKNLDFSHKDIINYVKTNPKIIGIGETGLDFFYKHSDKKSQIKLFTEHLKASTILNIPAIVHSRNAEEETLKIIRDEIKKNKNLKVLIHCFTGSHGFASQLIDLGCYISLSGIITFKNSQTLVKTVETIPLNKMLIETDSPFLAPVPKRGKTNEPSFIKHTAEKLAAIKKINFNEISKKTSENFLLLFNLAHHEN